MLKGIGYITVTLGVLPAFGMAGALRAQEPKPEAPPAVRAGAPQEPPARRSDKPWLGVGLETREECREDVEDECRVVVLISSVVVGSPAEAAGIEVGDIIVSFDDAAPASREFRARLDGMEVGRPVAIRVARSGQPVALEVVPAPRPPKPIQVRVRPSVRAWTSEDGERVWKVPIVIESEDGGAGWSYRSGDEGYVVVVPSEDGWKFQVLSEQAEGEVAEALERLQIELRELEQHMEHAEAEAAEHAREKQRYWGRVKAELGPEMAALRDSVLDLARAKLAEVRKARQSYRAAERARSAPPPELMEASRRIAGAEFEPLGPDLRHEGLAQGLLVLRVISGTPAWDLGLRRGDVVIEVAGAECKEVADLRSALVRPGDESVTVKWVRDGEVLTGALNENE